MTMTFPALEEVTGKLTAKRKELHDLFADAKNDAGELDHTKIKGFSSGSELAEHVRGINAEIDALAKEQDNLSTLKAGVDRGSGYDPDAAEGGAGTNNTTEQKQQTKTFGDLFVDSKAGWDLKGHAVEIDFDVKTLFETGAGWAPDSPRTPRVVLDEQRPVQLVPLVPQRNTSLSSWTYMEETTFTNNAAETAEGAEKPEGALALTERTANVRKIAVWIPVTDEQLEDVEGIRQYLDNRLSFMVMQRLDGQMVSGDGSAPNLRGLLNVSDIQTQAKGTDPVPDAIYKAMTKVQVTGQAMANTVVMHPNDWQEVRLLRTADGVYIWGNPSEAGPERIWGLPVAKVQAMTEGTGVVFDRNVTELAWKKGMELKVSDSHSDYFIKNKQAVRAEIRVAWTVYQPTAVCQVTGI